MMNRFRDGQMRFNRNYAGGTRVSKSELRAQETAPAARLTGMMSAMTEEGAFYLDYQEVAPAELQRDSDAW